MPGPRIRRRDRVVQNRNDLAQDLFAKLAAELSGRTRCRLHVSQMRNTPPEEDGTNLLLLKLVARTQLDELANQLGQNLAN